MPTWNLLVLLLLFFFVTKKNKKTKTTITKKSATKTNKLCLRSEVVHFPFILQSLGKGMIVILSVWYYPTGRVAPPAAHRLQWQTGSGTWLREEGRGRCGGADGDGDPAGCQLVMEARGGGGGARSGQLGDR